MIKIVEHRAGWCSNIDSYDDKTLQNTPQGFRKSFERGNGVETDLRDNNNTIVISHDLPNGEPLTFEEFLVIYKEYSNTGTLALNIKSDCLQNKIKVLLSKYEVYDYFVFDMSIPDSIGYIREDINSFIRDSEYENNPEESSTDFYALAKGVWLDQFKPGKEETSRISYDLIKKHLEVNKKICIVSPELHPWGRTKENLYAKSWSNYKEIFTKITDEGHNWSDIMLCTDLPVQAHEFFND